MAAYVEIIFDNSDGRLSVESDEVVLRRTIGHKKDEFFVNRKRVQKAEVQSLLESAGFSKSNPYYIVQQGKVANLCVMKDTDRLALLKDIAGTTIYEDRRQESLRILADTRNKQERIEEVLAFIEERLTELEKEKEELTEYDRLDKQRRALEYTLYDKELSRASEQLASIEVTRESEREKQGDVFSRLQAVQDEIQQQEDALTAVRASLERVTARKLAKKQELEDAVTLRTELEVRLQEAEASTQAQGDEKQRLREELVQLNARITQAQMELTAVGPAYDSLHAEQAKTMATLEMVRARVEQLYGKQGRGRQFSSKQERDVFLQEQIDGLQRQVNSKSAFVKSATTGSDKEQARIQKEHQLLASAKAENVHLTTEFGTLTTNKAEKTVERNQLQDTRKSSWRSLEEFQEKMADAKQDLDRGRQQLNSVLPRNIAVGLRIVEEFAREHQLEGYYGPLIDNFQLRSDAFRTAVEVAAGNALFHVIVDTNETAALLMRELEKRKMGRLTFLPLNRISAPDVKYPDSTDVRPMVDVALEFDSDFEVAIKHVFGKKLLARDLDVAAHFSKEFDLDAITRDGDLVNRRGGFEGGFHDERVSKIGAVQKIREASSKIAEFAQEEAVLRTSAEEIEVQVGNVMRELQVLEGQREHTKSQIEQFSRELNGREKALATASVTVNSQREGATQVAREITTLQQQISFYQVEQKTELRELDASERDELLSLSNQDRALQAGLESTQRELAAANRSRETLRAELQTHLLKRKAEVTAEFAAADMAGVGSGSQGGASASDVTALRLEQQHASSVVAAIENEQDAVDAQDSACVAEIAKVEKELESLRLNEQKYLRSINEATKMHDKLLNRRSMLMETVQAKQKAIRELGTLPRAELDSSKSLSEKSLLSEMTSVNEKLKKFAGVNRKALDQYVSFNEQRDSLLDRQTQLTEENKSINKLIDSLDIQKEEAILRTFRGVSMHFSQVFRELVRGGSGKLVMRTSDDIDDLEGGEELLPDSNDDEDEMDEGDATGEEKASRKSKALTKSDAKKPSMSVATFQGVQVRVSFSGTGQQYEMRQLSGGQKALVALALIFAIQRCDPAPFYLFDEIDQALDANYRLEVARLIERQANDKTNPAQFITTTFRPEMVSVAHRHYGIALVNKTSNIYPLAKQDAENFVLDLLMDEEAVGAVTSVATYGAGRSSTSIEKEQIAEAEDFSRDRDPDEPAPYEGGEEFGARSLDDDDDVDENPEQAKQHALALEMGVQLEGEESAGEGEGEGEGEGSEGEEEFPYAKKSGAGSSGRGRAGKAKTVTKQIQGQRRKVRTE